MIIPSIDIQNGQAVQLINGKKLAIEGGDPFKWAEKFSVASEIAVIDLDAAMGISNNEELIISLCKKYRCRVGGGIRSTEKAIKLLDSGANKIIIGTNANPDFLTQFPKERLIAAVDSMNGKVMSHGWIKSEGIELHQKISEINQYVSEFLVTFIENEGCMTGIDIDRAIKVKEIADSSKLVIAGGVKSIDEVIKLDELNIDAQVGMALYSNEFNYPEVIARCMIKEQLMPTIIVDELGIALGLVWSNYESIRESINSNSGVYYSRSRGKIWKKGNTSGATQELIRIDRDCDKDTLRFTVKQNGLGFCHKNTYSCFDDHMGFGQLLKSFPTKINNSSSYTSKLLADTNLLVAKLKEELLEVLNASTKAENTEEFADLFYFIQVLMHQRQINFHDIQKTLNLRAKKITRQRGEIKNEFIKNF
jgi:phosphoribosyl-ATP pyrophosphohydrolase/phosphoribosyl-AMP cyclohydrolase